MRWIFGRLLALFAVASLSWVTCPPAQAVEFQTITIKVGYGAGGGYDQTSRLIARHLGRFLPGQPNIIVQNVPGGGSLKLTKMLVGSEPADGSVIASISEAMFYAPILDPENATFDPLALQWIGSLVDDPAYLPALQDLVRGHGVRLVIPLADLDHLQIGRASCRERV